MIIFAGIGNCKLPRMQMMRCTSLTVEHSKCTGEKPCKSCVKASVECRYEEIQRRKPRAVLLEERVGTHHFEVRSSMTDQCLQSSLSHCCCHAGRYHLQVSLQVYHRIHRRSNITVLAQYPTRMPRAVCLVCRSRKEHPRIHHKV
jgi:hypothetical protein